MTSWLSLDDTTVPRTLVDADDMLDVLVDDWPLCVWSLWASTGLARASDVAAARQNKTLFLISPPLGDQRRTARVTTFLGARQVPVTLSWPAGDMETRVPGRV
jgi:hypothetical protein